jgi:hypothetical protein
MRDASPDGLAVQGTCPDAVFDKDSRIAMRRATGFARTLRRKDNSGAQSGRAQLTRELTAESKQRSAMATPPHGFRRVAGRKT